MSHHHPPPLAASTYAHLQPSNPIAAAYVLGATLCTAAALWLSAQPHAAVWLGGQILLGACLIHWFVLLHECGHQRFFRTRTLHDLVGHVAAFWSVIPFHCWRQIHNQHHKWTGWQDLDPTTESLVPRPLGTFERVLANVCWRTWFPVFSLVYRTNFWSPLRLRTIFDRPAIRRRLYINVVLQLGAYAAVISWLGPLVALRLVGLAYFGFFVCSDLLILSQHTHIPMQLSGGEAVDPFPAPDQGPFTRSLVFPAWISRYLLIHFDAHEKHHIAPAVPAYHLDRVEVPVVNDVRWWRWILAAKKLKAEVFLFQNRTTSGYFI